MTIPRRKFRSIHMCPDTDYNSKFIRDGLTTSHRSTHGDSAKFPNSRYSILGVVGTKKPVR